jgi:hypothetical protein
MTRSRTTLAAVTAAATLSVAGAAIGAQGADTTIAVKPRTTIAAPAASPITFPGVHGAARKGSPLPAGNVAVARTVTITRGAEAAFGALRITCPAQAPKLRALGTSGDIGFGVLQPRTTSYSGKRFALVMASPITRGGPGTTVTGAIHGLCRR